MTNINEKALETIKVLRDRGDTVWSISRLNTANQCLYEYHQTYNLKQRGISNCYSSIGSFAHQSIEDVYNGVYDKDDFADDLENKLAELELKGIKFPSDDIRRNFTYDVLHYAKNFKLLSGKYILEKLLLFKVGDHFIQGYVDMINITENNEINITDWKTSSKFSGKKKLQDAGRQLVLYKMGIEATSKSKVDKVQWCMLKYITVNYLKSDEVINSRKCKIDGWVKTIRKQIHKLVVETGVSEETTVALMDEAVKNNSLENLPQEVQDTYWLTDFVEDDAISQTHLFVNSVKSPKKYGSKMCSRRKWVQEMRNNFEKDLLNNGVDDLEISILLDDAEKRNDIDNLPSFIQNKYWTEDCYVEYDVDQEKIDEVITHINTTIEMINSLDKEDSTQWKPLDFENESFYCNHLCNHRSSCSFLKDYKASLNLQRDTTFTDLSLDDIL